MKVLGFVKAHMLVIALLTGLTVAVLFHLLADGSEWERNFAFFAKDVQPAVMAVVLFLQFVKVSPHDLKVCRWHFLLLAFQLLMFGGLALLSVFVSGGQAKLLIQSAMLCFICPTAAAAGVITDKLGGSLQKTVSYNVLVNVLAAIVIPLVVCWINPDSGTTFLSGFLAICKRTFPLLVLPLVAAWIIRYCWRRLQRLLMHYVWWAFYLWGVSLALAIYLAMRALLNSGVGIVIAVAMAVVALLACVLQFVVGRKCGASAAGQNSAMDSVTAGQALGQKNTGFLIWVGYSFLDPVTSIVGGFYSIWQNLFNSWELKKASEADLRR